MSEGSPEKPIPQLIEPRKFAQLGVSLQGSIPAEKLDRLKKSVCSVVEASAKARFYVNDHRERCVSGDVRVSVERECQRCLEPVRVLVKTEFSLGIVWSEDDANTLTSSLEPWIVPEENTDLYKMLEDEIFLALPFVSYHEGACVDSKLFESGPVEQGEVSEKENPFHILKQLKDSN